jgi:hypothetical protein
VPTVGYATLQVIPSVQGIGNQIREQIIGPVAESGDQASEGFAKRLAKGLAIGVAGAAAAVGAVLVKGLGDVLEQGQITGKLQAQLGATGPDAAKYGKVAGQLFSGTMAESFEQGTEAIRSVMSAGLLPPGATEAQIKQISTKVLDLSTAFDVDLGETATAVGQLIRNGMAKDAQSGLDLVAAGLRGTDARGQDVLETFGEYSPVFKTMGLDGSTAMGLLRQGLEGGARSTDNVADAIKEFSLKVTGGGKAIDEAFKAAGLNATKVTDDVAAGGPRATAALGTVLDALRQMPATAERAQVIQNLFGGPGEDLGAAIFSLNVKTAASSLGTLAGAADATGNALRDNAATKIEAFKRSLEQGVVQFVGGQVLPALQQGASFLTSTFGPAFGEATDWIRGSAIPAAAGFAHEVADRLVPAAASGATWLKDHLGEAASKVGTFVRDDLLPAASQAANLLGSEFGPVISNVAGILANDVAPAVLKVGGWLAANLLPAVRDGAVWLGEHLVPAVASVATWLTGTFVPALIDTARWLNDNRTTIGIVAAAIGTLLLPVLITTAVSYTQAGIAATVSAAQQVAAWFTTGSSAVTNSALSVAASYQTVGGWIASGASAVASGAQQVAAWVAAGARAVWGMALQAAAAAEVVAGWVLMGVQSLLRAGQMAAAWLIAMGPVGLIIAAVVGLVALIVLNWDTVKNATITAWNFIWGLIKDVANFIWQLFLNWSLPGLIIKHWQSIKDGAVAGWNAVVDFVKQVPSMIYNAFLNFTPIGLLIKHWDTIKQGAVAGFSATVEWIKGVPQMILTALGSLGNLLLSAGGDVVRGLWNGISNMGGWLKDKLIGFAKSAIPGPIASALGINSPSRVMRDEVGRWIPAGIEEGIEGGRASLARTMAGLVDIPDIVPASWSRLAPAPTPAPAYAAAGQGAASGGYTAAGAGPALYVENYYESESGGAQQTAMDLMVLAKARG